MKFITTIYSVNYSKEGKPYIDYKNPEAVR